MKTKKEDQQIKASVTIDRNTIDRNTGAPLRVEEAYTGGYELTLPADVMKKAGLTDGDDIIFLKGTDPGTIVIRKA